MPTGKWKAFQEIPNTVSKIKSMREHVEARLADRFGGRVAALSEAATALGGRDVSGENPSADGAWRFAPLPRLPVARVVWIPKPDLKVAAAAWIMAGGAHHTGFSQAVTAQHMEDYAEIAGIECVRIDEGTDLAAFKKELRWNEVYYHLARGV